MNKVVLLLCCYRLVPILLNGMKYSDLDIIMLRVSWLFFLSIVCLSHPVSLTLHRQLKMTNIFQIRNPIFVQDSTRLKHREGWSLVALLLTEILILVILTMMI